MRRLPSAATIGLLLSVLLAPLVAAQSAEKSGNVTVLGQVKYTGGTELAAHRRTLYSAELNGHTNRNEETEKGGIHIYRLSRTGEPEEVGFLHCPGNDNDVDRAGPTLIVVAYHRNNCGEELDDGMLVVDVSDKSDPRVIGNIAMPPGRPGSAHTLTRYPGTNYVYINPGGLGNGNSTEQIVDISNPRKPKIVASFGPADGGPEAGCHDLSFYVRKTKKLAFCAGKGEVSVWDVSKPLKPEVIGSIHNPAMEFEHYATPSNDGKLLAIDDEAFAFHECETADSPTGRVWIYDISEPSAPVLESSFGPPRGGDQTNVGTYPGWVPSWCLSHGLHWRWGTHILAVTWFTGGVSVLDLSEPTEPKEVAYYMAEDSATYSALWRKGHLYTNDMNRGLEAFQVDLGT